MEHTPPRAEAVTWHNAHSDRLTRRTSAMAGREWLRRLSRFPMDESASHRCGEPSGREPYLHTDRRFCRLDSNRVHQRAWFARCDRDASVTPPSCLRRGGVTGARRAGLHLPAEQTVGTTARLAAYDHLLYFRCAAEKKSSLWRSSAQARPYFPQWVALALRR